jgi:hypothetical protein
MSNEIDATREFLEVCKVRFVESQKRFTLANQNLQRAQQEFAAAQVEHNNWQGVVNSETRRLATLQQLAQVNQALLPITPPNPNPQPQQLKTAPSPAPTPAASAPAAPEGGNEINKTELVRELLAQHAEGMTPVEVWNVLKNQIARPYVYSILKRLKDADEAIYQKRRKKYSLRVIQKTEETNKEPAVIH